MTFIQKIITCSLVIVLCGCAAGAQTDQMTYRGSDVNPLVYDKALNKNVVIGTVDGGKGTNPAWTSEIGNEEFSAAVQSSLKSQGLFSEAGRYLLTATLVKVDQPFIGISFTVTTHVQYVLTDTQTSKTIIDKMIVTPYTARMGDALLAVKRLQVANEGAGKANIEALMAELSALSITGHKIAVK
jgi:hypothetical protein